MQEQHTLHNVEYAFRAKSGEILHGLYAGAVIHLGADTHIISVIHDITESKRIEAALRESEARFRNFFELGKVGMAITSPEKGWLAYNDHLCRMLGYSRAELKNFTWEQLTHPDDLQADLINFNRVLNGEIDGYSIDKRFIHKQGGVISTSMSVHVTRSASGEADHFSAVLLNITERKQMEAALRDRNNILARILLQSAVIDQNLE